MFDLFKFFDPFSSMLDAIEIRYERIGDFLINSIYAETFNIVDQSSLEEEYNHLFN